MIGYPPELVDAVAAELAAMNGFDWVFVPAVVVDGAPLVEEFRVRARRILDLLDREGALHRSHSESGPPVPSASH